MTTHYVLFVHGVSTRCSSEKPTYAGDLTKLIAKFNQNLSLSLKMQELDWYELMLGAEQQLLEWFNESPHWQQSWFKSFRQMYILPFVGDAILYISRFIGADVVQALMEQTVQALKGANPETDRLHFVTHSWGTVILFDVLFAGRWDDPKSPGYDAVQTIRKAIFGIEPESKRGIPIASIHTLGSPIALTNLMNVKQKEQGQKVTGGQARTVFTHDITLGLENLLRNLYNKRQQPLIWQNFAHPGDPVAYPLATVIPKLVETQDVNKHLLEIDDISTSGDGILELVASLFRDSFLALINGGHAHGSYFTSDQVAQQILQGIHRSTLEGIPVQSMTARR